MDQKIKYLIKDASVLMVITLISGFLLAMVYQITKGPIARQEQEKKMFAYSKVFHEAKKFDESRITTEILKQSRRKLEDEYKKFGKVSIEEILEVKSSADKKIGYVATVYSDEGYGGRIKISLGYDLEQKKLNGIEILDSNETAGLGAKIKEEEFLTQYNNKKHKELKLVKGSKSNDDEIVAISGATISSTAVTNSVNAALLILGGANEVK